tara:strand:+ start:12320 stop:13606 length:1287 start_codon:yes stop_codon:yes gene_type:complete
VRKNFVGSNVPDNVFLKILANGSEMIFSYACDNPDRARGYTADRVNYDEIQDILYDEVVPIINECMANSKYGYVGYMGTPKTMENTIEYLWQHSTQAEWCIKCEACGKHSYYVDDKGIGLKGPICLGCQKYVNPRNGVWVDMNPVPKDLDDYDPARQRVKGFHIPQLILPLNAEEPERWARILQKHQTYGDSEFKNEVLGVSDAIGSRLVSLEELLSCCSDYDISWAPERAERGGFHYVVGGVDWSGGGSKGHSRTVGWVWGVTGTKYTALWYRIFPQSNPVEVVAELTRVFRLYKCAFVFGDSGEGALANSLLKKQLPENTTMLQVQYGSSDNKEPLKWNGRDRYLADRTTMIDNFLISVKRGDMTYPKSQWARPAFDDMLNVFEEVTATGKKVWRHAPSQPDDALHAQIFGWIAGRVASRDLQFYT